MKSIKFRAWIREGEWEEDGSAQKYVMVYDLAYENFEPLNDLLAGTENLMQFTGLKDRNGLEIYEGDIILMGIFPFIVSWNEKLAKFYMKSANPLDTKKWSMTLLKDKSEKIGNIHENPELLK